MTDSRPKRGKGVQRTAAGAGSMARRWFMAAVALLGLSTVILAAVLANSANREDPPGPLPGDQATRPVTLIPATATPEVTRESPSPAVSPTATLAATVACGDILVPLGKPRTLGPDCAPPDLVALPDRMAYVVDLPILLRRDAAAAMAEMLSAADKDGLSIVVRSAYRSYADQVRTFNYWVSVLGEQEAERVSARPGHSEHQLGTTADLTTASNGFELEGFETTPEGRWTAANAARFGFVISYPEGKEDITGYVYEPWHVRYVGKAVALEAVASGLTLIEFLERR